VGLPHGETFYVGKGKGGRVFQRIRDQVDGDEINNKLKRIREIHFAGFERIMERIVSHDACGPMRTPRSG
jgi:hypothetical protein